MFSSCSFEFACAAVVRSFVLCRSEWRFLGWRFRRRYAGCLCGLLSCRHARGGCAVVFAVLARVRGPAHVRPGRWWPARKAVEDNEDKGDDFAVGRARIAQVISVWASSTGRAGREAGPPGAGDGRGDCKAPLSLISRHF